VRCFLHISEFGFEGYRYLPGLATISDDLVLWAPAVLQAREAQRAGASLVGPEEILGLIESGKVRVVGREHYLLEKASRKNGWPLAAWTSFDTEIAEIAEKDRDRPVDQRRVFFAAAEKGEDWARRELSERGPRVAQVEDLIGAPGALDPTASKLLPGLVEKLNRLSSHEQQVALALRDIRNHTLAVEEVRADISVEPLAFRELVAGLTGGNPPSGPSATPFPTLEGTKEMLEVVMSLSPLDGPDDLNRLLALKELPAVRLQIESLIRLSSQPKLQLEAELEAAGDLADWISTLIDPEPMKAPLLLDLVGVVLAVISEPALALTGPLTRLGCAAAQAADRYADYEQKIQAPIPYAGKSLPFILAFGDATATFERIGEIRRRLEEGGRAGLF
jgi:hypothetical protein